MKLTEAANPLAGSNFDQIYKNYREGIYHTAYRVCQNEADAQEVVSETFLKAYEHRGQFEGRAAVSTWLYRIAYFTSLDLIKRRQREATWELDYNSIPDDNSPVDNLVEQMAAQQQLQVLRQAMVHLHPEDRAILELRFDHGLPYEEIAAVMDIPANTVGTRIFRAKKLLFKLMKPGGKAQ
ncbi:MAG: RNA polymerase sigma factor [Methylocystaceae bacterium]